MRYVVVTAVLFFALTHLAQAEESGGSLWNDSNSIQLPGGITGGASDPGDTGGGGDLPSSGNPGEGFFGDGTSGGGTDTGGSAPSAPQGGASEGQGDQIIFSNTDATTNPTESGGTSAEDIIHVLVTSGAVVVTGSGAASASAGQGGSISINGGLIRDILAGKGGMRVSLRGVSMNGAGLFSIAKGAHLTNNDLGLIAASTALRDPSLESASIVGGEFDITYRAPAFLLGFVPIAMPVKIHVNPAAASIEARVSVKLPWYQFFVRKIISRAQIVNAIDGIIITNPEVPDEDIVAREARLFTLMTTALQQLNVTE